LGGGGGKLVTAGLVLVEELVRTKPGGGRKENIRE
jgi:hypothetical protein